MARLRALSAVFVVVLALVGCSKAEPEIDPVEQVNADNRPASEAAVAEGSEGGGPEADAGEDAPEDGEGGGAGGATWVAVDIAFDSAPTEVPAGEVVVTLDNQGAAVHNVTFPEISEDPVVEAQPGTTAEGTVELPAGTHTYICSVAGHEQLMTGEVTVK